MPILPKQTLSFKSSGRIHLNKSYGTLTGLYRDVQVNFGTPAEFQAEEQIHNALYLRALDELLAEKNHPIHDDLLRMSRPGRIISFGSRAHLVKLDMEELREKYGDGVQRGLQLGGNESTTRYQSYFNFLEKYFGGDSCYGDANAPNVRYPVLAWDEAALQTLGKYGVPPESFKKLAEHFLTLADIADHDYLHQIVNFRQAAAEGLIEFAPVVNMEATRNNKVTATTGNPREDLTLTLHAQVLRKLFETSPKRKAHVLSYAARTFEQLAEMQQLALAPVNGVAKTPGERHEINEAVTYFAELTGHRLFRIFPPDDDALTTEKTSSGATVAEAIGKLTLVTPNHLRPQGSETPEGFEQLKLNCTEWMGETYQAIHSRDTFPMKVKKAFAGHEPGIINVSALEALSLMSEAAAQHTSGQEISAGQSRVDMARARSFITQKSPGTAR